MCYSAQIMADYKAYTRLFGATIDLKEFYDTFWRRQSDRKIKIPKAIAAAFSAPQVEQEREIRALIEAFDAEEGRRLEQDLCAQRKRLAEAERALQAKVTKGATESKRIAGNKVDALLARLSTLRRPELRDSDSRIYPGYYAPVLIVEHGQRVVRPMRYQCRPAGKPAAYDTKYPGTYNARKDNLEGFWKAEFGHTHGLMLINAFYENVARHKAEHRELAPGEQQENVVLEFKPQPGQAMLVACLYSHWTSPGQPDLWSFAAITDAPPAEVAAAGHDRCVIPIKRTNVDAWLNPEGHSLAQSYAILEDRERPYYAHRKTA